MKINRCLITALLGLGCSALVAVQPLAMASGASRMMRVPILGVPSNNSAGVFCKYLASLDPFGPVLAKYVIAYKSVAPQTTVPYYGQYQGAPQSVAIPGGTVCVEASVRGAAGSGGAYYPPGNYGIGFFPPPNTLEVLVGKGGQYGGGGGLSGMFSGAPSAKTAILVAAGGPGYASGNCSNAGGPFSGGAGYGGSWSGCTGTPFGEGAHSTGFCGDYVGAQGGYGGGSSAICPGGSGMPGGSSQGYPGQDYFSPGVSAHTDNPGGGSAAGQGGIGANGQVQLTFFRH